VTDSGTNNTIINENRLNQPSPDSIKALVTKQIKTYTTQAGDTLQSIAAANGITVQTLIDANKLTKGAALQPGWQLIILPIDGVVYTATSNDTLPDVAKRFSGNLDTIISYNGLANAEDIEDGQIIIIPGGSMPLPPAPKPTPKPKPKTDKSKIGGNGPVDNITPEPTVDDGTAHLFPKGYCTWYVAQKVHVPWGGNAKAWIANAKAYGAVVDQDPAHGTILVTNESFKYGHVAYVEQVTDHNTIIVSEMNYDQFGKVDTREISLNSSVIRGFIHP
jgi:surface antigen